MKDRALTLERFVVHADGREERVTSLASDNARGLLPEEIAPTQRTSRSTASWPRRAARSFAFDSAGRGLARPFGRERRHLRWKAGEDLRAR